MSAWTLSDYFKSLCAEAGAARSREGEEESERLPAC